ncbi:MAG: leucine--tRNA ligase [Christensenellaceae bacterium]|jgi:leucyl-tRNA synthetase|nr:leucine--tRNA ligase [Christensenellaceae bacterium]
MREYKYREIEQKWQKIWEKDNAFKAVDEDCRSKQYLLFEFPYPSGAGMHVGHVRAYSAVEALARKRRLQGYNVLCPVGYDAFGLPAENYAIKTGKHPGELTKATIANFSAQIKRLGFGVDWSRQIATCEPEFYKWTQWIFLQMFKRGLAYRAVSKVNFCEKCKCVLANEDCEGGKCDRCHTKVVQKERMVWFLKIRDYAERLLEGLDRTEFLESVKQGQRHWIGKSEGLEIDFLTTNGEKITVYTTRADTVFGITFLVIAPEHKLLKSKDIRNATQVSKYVEQSKFKKEFDRKLNKQKTGVKLDGINAVNPFTGKEIPIFVADYVLGGHGTGAIIAVPAHDQRDYEFAKKYKLNILQIIEGDITQKAYEGDGKHINSDFINGMNIADATKSVSDYCIKNKIGRTHVDYAITDWAFNRQRYWGEPIPIVYCKKCGTVPVPESELPLTLPFVDDYKPDEEGNSPLSRAQDFVNCKCPKCNGPAQRETDTMPQWAGSSAYWLRFMDPHNNKEFVSKDKMKYWNQVDLYSGGQEHVTRHLIYARFWHKFLFDLGVVDFDEPFKRRVQQGLILSSNGSKMSKSAGNVVGPIEYTDRHGADVFRVHLYFLGDFSAAAPWNDDALFGCERFIRRVWNLPDIVKGDEISEKHIYKINQLIKKVDDDSENLKFNGAIASLMEFLNVVTNDGYITKDELYIFLQLLYPFAPHTTEELSEIIGKPPIYKSVWPKADEKYLLDKTFNMPVQINGKLKGVVVVNQDDSQEQVLEKIKATTNIDVSAAKKIVFVKNKIISIIK